MAFCPECEAEIEGEAFDFEEGEVVECPDCGAELEVTNTAPLEFDVLDSDWDDDDDEEDWD